MVPRITETVKIRIDFCCLVTIFAYLRNVSIFVGGWDQLYRALPGWCTFYLYSASEIVYLNVMNDWNINGHFFIIL